MMLSPQLLYSHPTAGRWIHAATGSTPTYGEACRRRLDRRRPGRVDPAARVVLSLGLTFLLGLACAAAVIFVVVAAVHHAEVVAHRLGEPFGTLVLALAITVIEVALVVSMMLTGGCRQGHARPRLGLRGSDDHL